MKEIKTLFLVCCLLTCVKPGIAQPVPADSYANIQGVNIHYQLGGKGAVTVIFESGFMDDLHSWDNIFPGVAKFARVFRYDRPGNGTSDSTTEPRSFEHIEQELQSVLQKADIKPPYILVGHSMGGALIRAFASLYPQQVKGMVLEDPFNEYEADGINPADMQRQMQSMDSFIRNKATDIRGEFSSMNKEMSNGFPLLKSYSLPDVPTILLVAGNNRPPNWEKNLVSFYENKIHGLSETRMIVLPGSPHYIHDFDPALMIESIRRVVFPDPMKILRNILNAKGAGSCITYYKKLKAIYPPEYMLERFLNTLGYEELKKGHTAEAIKLFKVNVMYYPGSSNVYDSLAEAYLKAGNSTDAIKNYQISLRHNPANDNAKRMIEKLKK